MHKINAFLRILIQIQTFVLSCFPFLLTPPPLRKKHPLSTQVTTETAYEESAVGFAAGPAIQCDDNPAYLPAPPACKDGSRDPGYITFHKEKHEMLEGGSEGYVTPPSPPIPLR